MATLHHNHQAPIFVVKLPLHFTDFCFYFDLKLLFQLFTLAQSQISFLAFGIENQLAF